MPVRGYNLTLPQKAFEDFAVLASGRAELEYLSRNTASLKHAASLDTAIEQLKAHQEAQSLNLDRVWPALVSLAVLRRGLAASASEMLASLSNSIAESAPEWLDQHGLGWREVQPSLEVLLEANGGVSLLEKSHLLAYSYSNVLTGTQLITDIRPIFDDDANKVERVSVSFVLAIDYHDGERNHRMDLALDHADIERLLEQCQRAQVKAKTVLRQFASPNLVVSVAGISETKI